MMVIREIDLQMAFLSEMVLSVLLVTKFKSAVDYTLKLFSMLEKRICDNNRHSFGGSGTGVYDRD